MSETPAYAAWAGLPLDSIPAVDAGAAREEFGARNRLGVTAGEAERAAARAEHGGDGEVRPGVIAGFSTGTSGRRGVFLASSSERADYLGQSVARLSPASALVTGSRIALILRANSSLYRDVGRAGAFSLRFLPLGQPPQRYAEQLRAFRPDVLIAPAHMLATFARRQLTFPGLRRLFWGAEPMGEAERNWIHDVMGVRPDPIWQATEGFLGAACAHGSLHLNEGSIAFDWSPIAGDAFQAIVTDLRRTTQPVVRLRLDDIVEFETKPCACRFGGRIVRPISGRVGDIWRLPNRTLFPREITDAFEAALGPAAEWLAIGSASKVTVRLRDRTLGGRVADALGRLGVSLPNAVEIRDDLMADGPKRRRVRWSAS